MNLDSLDNIQMQKLLEGDTDCILIFRTPAHEVDKTSHF